MNQAAADPILRVSNIETYYGPIQAIRSVSLEVPRGKIVTVLGANLRVADRSVRAGASRLPSPSKSP